MPRRRLCTPSLKPETSKGWNLGAVFSPAALPRFSVEANYYKIKIKGAIQSRDADTTLRSCVINNDAAGHIHILTSQDAGYQMRALVAELIKKGLSMDDVRSAFEAALAGSTHKEQQS